MALKSTGGISLPKIKNTAGMEIRSYDCPDSVKLDLPEGCFPCVSEGDVVSRFQPVARDEEGFIVAASIPGTVRSCNNRYILIKNDMSQNALLPDPDKPASVDDINYDSLLDYCRRYGIRGAFSGVPLYRKLASAYGSCERIIINCLESDPYSGHVRSLVSAHAREIVLGAKILMIGMGVKKCVFALGKSYDNQSNLLEYHAKPVSGMIFAYITEKYPAGNEHLLLDAIYRKEFSRAVTAESEGYPVISAETVYELFSSLCTGLPSIYKTLTLTGKGFVSPCNIRVPNGCAVADLIDFAGARIAKYPVAFALGGSMNGEKVSRSAHIKSNTNMLTAFKDKRERAIACIRCARCASFCPMQLVPFLFHDSFCANEPNESTVHGLYNCIECGICAYMCVSGIDLLAEIREQKRIMAFGEDYYNEEVDPVCEPQSDDSAPETADEVSGCQNITEIHPDVNDAESVETNENTVMMTETVIPEVNETEQSECDECKTVIVDENESADTVSSEENDAYEAIKSEETDNDIEQ